jgi:hypothetical protein
MTPFTASMTAGCFTRTGCRNGRISLVEMGKLRAHQRWLVKAWLVCQLLVLAAFAPCVCCDVVDEDASDHCHRAAEGAHCPMVNAGDGQPCPMHPVSVAEAAEADGSPDCVMHGVCDRADVALSGLLSSPGVLPDIPRVVLSPSVSAMAAEFPHASSVAPVHDTPPPRL